MAFNPLEYLEQGKVHFLYDLSYKDLDEIKMRIINSNRREQIVDGCFHLLKDIMGRFCFSIMYDIPKYKNEALDILHNCYKPEELSKDMLVNIMYKTSYGKEYIEENFYDLINSNIKDLNVIFVYLFSNYDDFKHRLKEISLSKDLHIRFLFMRYLVLYAQDKISIFYDDMTKYLTSVTHQQYEQLTFLPEYMNIKDISELAYLILINYDYDTYLKIKTFIFDNYKENEIGYLLLNTIIRPEIKLEKGEEEVATRELMGDIDGYFKTSKKYKLKLFKKYSHLLSEELVMEYKRFLSYFKVESNLTYRLDSIDYYGLIGKLEEYLDKYLSLSKSTNNSFIASGSTACVFRIGDYVFKLLNYKYNLDEVICPDLYIIIQNLEEEYFRNPNGTVVSGIEVQKYLEKNTTGVPNKIFDLYLEELKKLGYCISDTLVGGECGDNCRLYDSYLDSGNPNPPEWFKKYPLVLVDRDCVHRL